MSEFRLSGAINLAADGQITGEMHLSEMLPFEAQQQSPRGVEAQSQRPHQEIALAQSQS